MIRRREHRWAVATASVLGAGLVLVLVAAAPLASAQTASSSPTRAGSTPASASASPAGPSASPLPSASPSTRTPILEGDVTGSDVAGQKLEIRVDATMPGGWQALHLVDVSMVTGGREVDHLTYDIEDAKVTLDGHNVAVGTGAEGTGRYLRVDGAHVIVTTGGGNLSIRVDADVVRAIPPDARFRLSVTGDRGETAAIVRELAAPPSEGLTWTTVVTAVILALFAGGFVGNVFASRRRAPASLSVYATIQRRLDAERSGSSRS